MKYNKLENKNSSNVKTEKETFNKNWIREKLKRKFVHLHFVVIHISHLSCQKWLEQRPLDTMTGPCLITGDLEMTMR